ncbi:MAG TPA: family 20 glycosylhydrolase, partial [Rhodanobacteraceae bacterium]|nr:family 20 glycosylhydrolase [Rhodanobacteraceae bacterium]
AARGRRAIGWDEMLEGGVPADAIVMSWRGAKGAVDAAKLGHDVVMTPDPDLYLDHLQSDALDEPPGRPSTRTLADIHAFEAVPAGLPRDAASHVLGAEAALWTEHMRTAERVEHAAFPRLDALAEALWSPQKSRDWRSFVARLVVEMDRHRALGVRPAESAFEVRIDAKQERDGGFAIALTDQGGLPIRYTTDGRDPDARSPLYESPLHLAEPVTLRAAAFAGERRLASVRTQAFTRESALERAGAALGQCSGRLVLRLEDDAPAQGPRAAFDVDLFDPCWTWPAAPLDGVDGVSVDVGAIPYNFQLAGDAKNIVPRPAPSSRDGELLVKRDGCSGPTLATLPLAPAARNPALTTLSATWRATTGAHDLCFVFATHGTDPLWAIDRVRLLHPR